ncbi:MAG TPA: Ig-like domain-containing protein [Burkholderiales bacterium]
MNNRARHFVAVILLLLVPFAAAAAGVEVLVKSMFPSDRHTRLDFSQNTFRRVNLAKPADCASTPAKALQCQDIDVLNTLDGFNLQPRLSIPFSGPIDVSSVNSESVFLISLGSTTSLFGGSFGDKVGINQAVWDTASNTLHVESDELLEQHTRYALVVTSRVRDAAGDPIGARSRRHADDDDDDDRIEKSAKRHGVRIVGASIFTTQSTTSTLQKVHTQVNAAHPAPARFDLGSAGERTVFPLASLLPPGTIIFTRDRPTPPAAVTAVVPVPGLAVIPGVVGTLAFGSYQSPDYHVSPGEFIPPTGTRTGVPAVQRMNTIGFTLVLPAGARPTGGWPVAIYGHGFTDSRHGSPYAVGAGMAAQGVATIAINVVGHGFGPLGTLTVNRNDGQPPVTLSAGGRGIDQNGNGTIDSTEGSAAGAPRILVGSSDALRQTTIDLMQLVRVIQSGVDVDGDGTPDLDGGRIYYFGQSFGGLYGTIFLGVERDVRVGVPNVPGGSIIEIVRLSPSFRGLLILAAIARELTNAPPPVFINENFPLRDLAPVVNNVAGAMALQNYIEQSEWASQPGNPVAYAPYLRKSPLPGNPVKSVILQFALGDQTVPNPTTTAIIRAGELQDRVTYFRNDLARAAFPTLPANPHTFLTGLTAVGAPFALAGQGQIAAFFASHGAVTLDPDTLLPATFPHVFETPIVPPLPEVLNF